MRRDCPASRSASLLLGTWEEVGVPEGALRLEYRYCLPTPYFSFTSWHVCNSRHQNIWAIYDRLQRATVGSFEGV